MKNYITVLAIALIITTPVVYLLGAFIGMEFDLRKWHDLARLSLVVISIISALVITGFIALRDDE